MRPNIALLWVTYFFFSAALSIQAQRLPEFTLGFSQNEVASIYLTLPADSLIAMYTGGNNTDEYVATFAYSGAWSDTSNMAVTMRLRGNTSINAQKKSFRINFDGVIDSQEWQGLEKLNLIGLQNDPSLVRSKLCHDAFRQAGVFSSQTSFVRVYINNDYMGLYQNQEHIDEEFCKLYFDQQGDGNLYKCTYPATLEYLGTNPDLYKFALWGTRHYELKTNEWRDQYADLAQFIALLNNTPLSQLACALPEVFDVETYLKTMAIDVITGNWDNYIYNKNNFYLYHHQLSDQFVYLPYDLDNTLGIDWIGIDWTTRDPYTWKPSNEERPLFERILEIPEFRQKFTNYLIHYSTNELSAALITTAAEAWQNNIQDAALEDLYRTLDFGFDNNAFLQAITEAWGNHVPHGIVDYLELRNGYLSFQTDPITSMHTVVHWLHASRPAGENASSIQIRAFMEEWPDEPVALEVSSDNVTFSQINQFNDNGALGDLQGNDQIYTAVLDNTFNTDQLYYRLRLSDGSYYPCEPKMMWITSPSSGIVINEIMTQNTNAYADEYGQYDDWVELYNATSSDINLSGYYLTDDLNNPNQFPLPAITLAASDFLLFWLDDDVEQGALHSNFNVGSNDNVLWLIRTQTSELRIQDSFAPCISSSNQSMERQIDGGEIIQLAETPTPGYSNVTAIAETPLVKLFAYPNPTSGTMYFSQTIATCTLHDAVGRAIKQLVNANQMDVTELANGLYTIRLPDGQVLQFVKTN
jgi:hypothetical protein